MLCGMQAVAKALREREQALLTVQALENELGTKRRGISSNEESGQQVRCLKRPPCWPAARSHMLIKLSIGLQNSHP